jgi:hypothetical protein
MGKRGDARQDIATRSEVGMSPWLDQSDGKVSFGSWLCENSDAKRTSLTFTEFWPILSDQSPANREYSF